MFVRYDDKISLKKSFLLLLKKKERKRDRDGESISELFFGADDKIIVTNCSLKRQISTVARGTNGEFTYNQCLPAIALSGKDNNARSVLILFLLAVLFRLSIGIFLAGSAIDFEDGVSK